MNLPPLVRAASLGVVLFVLGPGCVFARQQIPKQTLVTMTAGVIGCPEEELTISGEPTSYAIGDATPRAWLAECRGHRFICSPGGKELNCTEELKQVSTRGDSDQDTNTTPSATTSP